MSPMYGRDIAVVSMIVMGTATASGPEDEFQLFAGQLEKLAGKYGGRPHWGKMNWAAANDLQPQYPKFGDFVRLRAELDPTDTFLNDYLRRVLLPGPDLAAAANRSRVARH
jgi:L-gulonolactone oxidase